MSRCLLIPEGLEKLAPGRGAPATTTRGLVSPQYPTPEWVAEGADVHADCRPFLHTAAPGADPLEFPSGGARRDRSSTPRLPSVIPAGIQNLRLSHSPILKGMRPRSISPIPGIRSGYREIFHRRTEETENTEATKPSPHKASKTTPHFSVTSVSLCASVVNQTPLPQKPRSPTATCQSHLIPCQSHLIFCQSHLISCQSHLISCQSQLISCQSHLISCQSQLISCQSQLFSCHEPVTYCMWQH